MRKNQWLLQLLVLNLFAVCANAQAPNVKPNPYYDVSVSATTQKGVAIQAFMTGRKGDTLLFISGRTNGFHNFPAAPVASFPSSRSNDSIIVLIPSANKVIRASLSNLLTPLGQFASVFTNDQMYQLASTNVQGCQSGDTLYGIGGYGYNGTMTTFGECFAINIPRMINLVLKGGDSSATVIKKAISFANQPAQDVARVTGGELLKMGNSFYLVVGQRFEGEYTNNPYSSSNINGYKQQYTCSVTPYSFNWTSDTVFNYVTQAPYVDNNNLHRRDLNVVPVLNAQGPSAIHVYGGVFTGPGGPYLHPVEVAASVNGLTATVSTMNQLFNQYAAAHLSIFDTVSNKMFTTILGGITLYDSVANSANNSGVAAGDSTMPWSSIISTMVKDNKTGTITEYASDKSRLPGLIGGESKFIPYKRLLIAGSDEVIDLQKVKRLAGGRKVRIPVGIMLGGIISTLPQTATRSQTQSNYQLYTVYMSLK